MNMKFRGEVETAAEIMSLNMMYNAVRMEISQTMSADRNKKRF